MSTTTTTVNVTTEAPPTLPPSIFVRTTEAPFVIFMLLSIILVITTLAAIAYMARQHSAHLDRMNAVRGFHQQDVEAAKSTLATAEETATQGSRRRRSTIMGGSFNPDAVSGAGTATQQQQPLKVYRMCYDFHSTPKQPPLPDPSHQGAAPPAMDLGKMQSSGSGSFAAPSSPNRSVGMKSFRVGS